MSECFDIYCILYVVVPKVIFIVSKYVKNKSKLLISTYTKLCLRDVLTHKNQLHKNK